MDGSIVRTRVTRPNPQIDVACQAPRVEPLSEGLYEAVVTARLDRMLVVRRGLRPEFANVGAVEAPGVLARHLSSLVHRAVLTETDDSSRVALVNELIALLDLPDDSVLEALRELVLLRRNGLTPDGHDSPPDAALAGRAAHQRPDEPSLSAELRAEIASADRIDLLCAFIRWHGLRVLERRA